MWNDVLLERLTTMIGRMQSRATTADRIAVVAPALSDDAVEALRRKAARVADERAEALRAAKKEFDDAVLPTRDALEAVMRERKELLDERRKTAERADAERRKAIYEEYKDAIAPAADARDIALVRAERRWERKAAKINEEHSRRIARLSALAVLGVEEGEET